MIKELPIGIQTFSELIQKNYVYVDKTAMIYNLISKKKYYFFARPRRFGKSLLISTLEEIFNGTKALFAGLAIGSLPYDWQTHPVIMISFSDITYTTPEKLESGIKIYLQQIGKSYNIILDERLNSGQMLQDLVRQLSEKKSVVLLVDEYDYPILQHIHSKDIAQVMRDILKGFYAVIKGLDKYLRFVFVTGVSKFSQTSLFSGLNNLQDITLKPEFNALVGYTATEITTNFEHYLERAMHSMQFPMERLLTEIKAWYDGYQFTKEKDATKIYNP
jgi:hypothetical protein